MGDTLEKRIERAWQAVLSAPTAYQQRQMMREYDRLCARRAAFRTAMGLPV